jgi:predicted TIM-barrel fold metal-dependent hydrolase
VTPWFICRRLKGLSNVWVDTSFQSPEAIVKLIKVFGEDKVMYASDWPFGYRPPHIKTVKVACKGSRELEDLLFFKNAQRFLNLIF